MDLLAFATEILHNIFLYLPRADLLVAPQVCHALHLVMINEDYWRRRYLLSYGDQIVPQTNSWKKAFYKYRMIYADTVAGEPDFPSEFVLLPKRGLVIEAGYNGLFVLEDGQVSVLKDKEIIYHIDLNQPCNIVHFIQGSKASLKEKIDLIISPIGRIHSFNSHPIITIERQICLSFRSKVKFIKYYNTTRDTTDFAAIDDQDRLWLGVIGGPHNTDKRRIGEAKSFDIADHILFIDLNDNVWAGGSNAFGQLGLSNQIPIGSSGGPKQIPDIKAKQVVCGYNVSFILDLSGTVYTCGAIAKANYQNKIVPTLTPIPNLVAREIAASSHCTFAIIDMDYNLWVYNPQTTGMSDLCRQVPGVKARSVSVRSGRVTYIAHPDHK